MELHAEVRIPFPPAVVFAACRDEMANLLPYLPAIRSISVTGRTENGPIVENAIEWKAGADLPAAFRALFGEKYFTWTDYATWDARTLSCRWRSESNVFDGAIHCGARDEFLLDDAGTLLRIRGALTVDGSKLRAVPRAIEGRVAQSLESFLVRKIQSDLEKTIGGFSSYLKERA